VSDPPTRQELEAARCWEPDDQIARRPAMTAFRQRSRLDQARWREAHGHPMGTQPYRPHPNRPPARPVGSRIPLDYGLQTGANLITPAALAAARARTSVIEPNQSFDHQRLWADLLSSEALAFNLFGDLAADLAVADRAVHASWPDVPGTVSAIRFAYSPGRLDPEYLNSLRAFDAAIVLDHGDGTQGIVGIDTKFHERAKSEIPKPTNLRRYVAVAEASGIFAAGAIDAVKGRSELAVMWLEHLLLLSMLQHPAGAWTWGRYVVVHPAGNPDIAELCARYRELLADASTFLSLTLKDLLDGDAIPPVAATAVRARYAPG
jgi:hypothetical protein